MSYVSINMLVYTNQFIAANLYVLTVTPFKGFTGWNVKPFLSNLLEISFLMPASCSWIKIVREANLKFQYHTE